MIPLHAPDLGTEEATALNECLRSGWISSAGPQVAAFEAALQSATGAAEVVVVQSGTAALHLALLALNLQPGDEVLVSDFTFIATANALRYVGATPVLVDAEADSWQADADLAAEYLPRARGRVKAILLTHAYGQAADLAGWLDLALRYELPLIEDAAGALGTRYRGQAVGTLADFGTLSFNGNKIVTTGGGGAILCRDREQAQFLRHLAQQAKLPGPAYDHDQVGYNYRLSGIAAALGLAQLQRLPTMLNRHATWQQRYQQLLPQARFPQPVAGTRPNYWLSSALLPERDAWQAHFTHHGIQTRPLWTPLHQQPPYQDCRYLTRNRVTELLWQQGLSLPSGSGLREAEWQQIQKAIRSFGSDVG